MPRPKQKITIEEVEEMFNLDDRDCTMVIESYGQCHDFPCTDCVNRIHKEINNGTLEI